MSKELTGGLVNYYLAPVTHPQRKEQAPYVAECEDITAALQMTPEEFCEFKAIWRTAAARLGNGKPGQKALYDAEKRLHYAGRDVAKYRRELGMPTEPSWVKYVGDGHKPESVDYDDKVEVIFSDGKQAPQARMAKNWEWARYADIPSSEIAYFRKV